MNTHLIVPGRRVRRTQPSLFPPSWVQPSLVDWNFDSLDRLFGSFAPPARSARFDFAPAIDVANTDDEICLTAELPGLQENDFEILVEGELLTLKGEKRSRQDSEQDDYRRVERTSGSFERRFRLGWDVDPDTVQASYKHGVLQVVIPKPAEDQSAARQIPVNSND